VEAIESRTAVCALLEAGRGIFAILKRADRQLQKAGQVKPLNGSALSSSRPRQCSRTWEGREISRSCPPSQAMPPDTSRGYVIRPTENQESFWQILKLSSRDFLFQFSSISHSTISQKGWRWHRFYEFNRPPTKANSPEWLWVRSLRPPLLPLLQSSSHPRRHWFKLVPS
jgi:hypothetical protein